MKALKQTDSKDNLCLSPLDLHFVDTAIVSVVNADRQQPDHAALDSGAGVSCDGKSHLPSQALMLPTEENPYKKHWTCCGI